jgi:hypothetical protein
MPDYTASCGYGDYRNFNQVQQHEVRRECVEITHCLSRVGDATGRQQGTVLRPAVGTAPA